MSGRRRLWGLRRGLGGRLGCRCAEGKGLYGIFISKDSSAACRWATSILVELIFQHLRLMQIVFMPSPRYAAIHRYASFQIKKQILAMMSVFGTMSNHYFFSPPTDAGLVPKPSSVIPVAGLANGLPFRSAAFAPRRSCFLLPLDRASGGGLSPRLEGALEGASLLDRFFRSIGGVSGVLCLGVEGRRPCCWYLQLRVS